MTSIDDLCPNCGEPDCHGCFVDDYDDICFEDTYEDVFGDDED